MFNLLQFTGLASLLLSLIWIASLLRVRFRSGLRNLPGPRLAAYSRLWNVKTAASGDTHEIFRRVHKKYGKLVRVGPNHVAISDPAMIPVIYGTNNKYLKARPRSLNLRDSVCLLNLTIFRPVSTNFSPLHTQEKQCTVCSPLGIPFNIELLRRVSQTNSLYHP